MKGYRFIDEKGTFTIEKCMETRVCVCKNCGTELYGYWHYMD